MNDFGTLWWAVIDYVLQVQIVQTGTGSFSAKVKIKAALSVSEATVRLDRAVRS